MFYVGMNSIDNLDVVETPVYNDELRELLEYFYGHQYSVVFVIEGKDMFIKHLYREPIESLLKNWTQEISWRATNREEYDLFLNHLQDLIG